MAFAENLARLQEERGVTNYKIAKDLGISQTTVANWKDGTSRPHALYMNVLAGYFGCTIDELLNADEKAPVG